MKNFLLFLTLFFLTSCGGDDKEIIKGERISALPSYPIANESIRSNTIINLGSPQNINECKEESCEKDNNLGNLAVNLKFEKVWQKPIGAGNHKRNIIISSPIVADNKIFTIDSKAKISCFTLEKGKNLWTYNLMDNASKKAKTFASSLSGKMLYNDKILYIGTGFGEVIAFDTTEKKELWRKDFESPIRSALSSDDDKLYFLTSTNTIYALNMDDGSIAWQNKALPSDVSIIYMAKPAIYGSYLVAGFSSGEVQLLDKSNGKILWNNELKGKRLASSIANLNAISANPIISDYTIYASSNSGTTYAIDLKSGKKKWEAIIGSMTTPILSGNAIFMLSKKNSLAAIDRYNGEIIWEILMPHEIKVKNKKFQISDFKAPILVNDNIIVLAEKLLLIFDAKDGKFKEAKKVLPFKAAVNPVVANDYLLLITTDGTLIAYK